MCMIEEEHKKMQLVNQTKTKHKWIWRFVKLMDKLLFLEVFFMTTVEVYGPCYPAPLGPDM